MPLQIDGRLRVSRKRFTGLGLISFTSIRKLAGWFGERQGAHTSVNKPLLVHSRCASAATDDSHCHNIPYCTADGGC
jgi:hypothetical protein